MSRFIILTRMRKDPGAPHEAKLPDWAVRIMDPGPMAQLMRSLGKIGSVGTDGIKLVPNDSGDSTEIIVAEIVDSQVRFPLELRDLSLG